MLDMGGPHCPEMPVVDRNDGVETPAFGNCNYRGVNKPKREVRIDSCKVRCALTNQRRQGQRSPPQLGPMPVRLGRLHADGGPVRCPLREGREPLAGEVIVEGEGLREALVAHQLEGCPVDE